MTKLAADDYDFSGVPQHELPGCLYYEYMRESEAIVSEVKRVRKLMLDEARRRNTKDGDTFSLTVKATKITQFNRFIFEAAIITILAGSKNFLILPWQKLSNSEKDCLREFPQRASKMHNENFQRKYPMLVLDTTLNDPKPCQKATTAALDKFLVSGYFQINMCYTQPELRAAFNDWLKANHPEGEEKHPERRGRKILRDQLNRLGAMRLRYHCKTFSEAKAKMRLLLTESRGMFYADRRSFNRACEAAVEHFHSLLKLDEKHLPIHFTKGWQK